MSDAEVRSCEQCGASIYPEHLTSHKAGYWAGKLFCVLCYAEHRGRQVTLKPSDFAHSSPTAAARQPAASVEPPTQDALMLDENEDPTAANLADGPILLPGAPAPGAFQGFSSPAPEFGEAQRLGRPSPNSKRGATRCRIFHAKLNDGALRFMQDQINEWVDQHPNLEIKHASTQVGIVESKSHEPHLIITVFY